MESLIITIAPFAQGVCLGSIVTFVLCMAIVGGLMWYANKKRDPLAVKR